MSLRMLLIADFAVAALLVGSPARAAPMSERPAQGLTIETQNVISLSVTLEDGAVYVVPVAVDVVATEANGAISLAVAADASATGAYTVEVEQGRVVSVTVRTGNDAPAAAPSPTPTDLPTDIPTAIPTVAAAMPAQPFVPPPPPVAAPMPMPMPMQPEPRIQVTAQRSLVLRQGPGNDFAESRSVAAGETLLVTGMLADRSWLMLADHSWVASHMVSALRGVVPTVAAIPFPQPLVMPMPTPMPTPVALPAQQPAAQWTRPNSVELQPGPQRPLDEAQPWRGSQPLPLSPAVAGPLPEQRGQRDPSSRFDPGCDPSYPEFCIAVSSPALVCAQIPYRNFRVLWPDRHGFDRDGNGLGCEQEDWD